MQTSEPTTLESAAESLLVPQQAEKPQEVEAEVDEDTTDYSEETDAEDEDATPDEEADEDEAEADEEDAEDDGEEVDPEDEDNEEDDEDEQPQERYTVKVDGEEVEVTLDDLKRSYSGQGYIQKRMKEVGDKSRETEEAYNAVMQTYAQLDQFVQNVNQQGMTRPPEPPSEQLWNEDPIAYMEQERDFKRKAQEYQNQIQQYQHLSQQRQQMEQAAKQKYLAEQRAKLTQEIPEFADAEKAGEIQRKIRDVATEAYGFSEDEIAGVMDARHVKVLNDARKYRELMANKEKATKKVRQSKPRVKPGAKKKADPNRKAREAAQKQLKQTGSLDAAVSLIMEN